MENVNNNKRIKEVIKNSMLELFLFLQGLIRLKGEKPKYEKRALLEQFVMMFDVGKFLFNIFALVILASLFCKLKRNIPAKMK